jgi:hypothetical protein
MDKERAILAHFELNLGLDLLPNISINADFATSGFDSASDLMADPGDNTGLAPWLSIREIPANYLGVFSGISGDSSHRASLVAL